MAAEFSDRTRFISEDRIGRWADTGNQGNGYSWAGSRYRNGWDPLGLADPAQRRLDNLLELLQSVDPDSHLVGLIDDPDVSIGVANLPVGVHGHAAGTYGFDFFVIRRTKHVDVKISRRLLINGRLEDQLEAILHELLHAFWLQTTGCRRHGPPPNAGKPTTGRHGRAFRAILWLNMQVLRNKPAIRFREAAEEFIRTGSWDAATDVYDNPPPTLRTNASYRNGTYR